jgi:hypothetical protein
MKYQTLTLAIVICLIYYLVGGESFPDYKNYITISEKGGWLFDENEYYFEWISRWWLREMPVYFSSQVAVNGLILFVQLTYAVWLLKSKSKAEKIAKYWITVLSGPLFLTTTARGTIAYIAAYSLVEKNKKLSIYKAFFFIILGLSFHDSFIIVVVAYAASLIFARYATRKIFIVLYVFSLLTIVLGHIVFGEIVGLILQFGIGIRDVYFQENSTPSILKTSYALTVCLIVLPLVNSKKNIEPSLILMIVILLAVSSILFSLSSTPAIRMLLYVSGMSILVGFSNRLYPRVFERKIFMIAIGLPIIFIMFWDLFRNANVLP